MLLAACDRGGTETDVFTCDQTRIALLEELGFHDYRVWDHITERALGELLPDSPLPDGYSIRSPTRDDRADLAAARRELFDEHWTGPEIAGELVAVAADGRVAAFIVMWLDHVTRVGLFEPVGTRVEFRAPGDRACADDRGAAANAPSGHAESDRRTRGHEHRRRGPLWSPGFRDPIRDAWIQTL